MKNELLLQEVGEFRGNYPDIPVPENIMQGIAEGDPNPFFLTLPVGRVGARSRKMQRSMTRRDIELIVSEVNAKKPEGRIAEGHPDPLERAKKLQQAQWLGATIDADGMAWAKAYIYPHAVAERQVLRTQMAANAKVGTSVFGGADPSPAGDWARLDLSAIDISTYADAVSQLDNIAVPVITSEMNETDNQENEDDNSMDKELVSELQANRDEWRDKAQDADQKVTTLTQNVAELTTERDTLQTTLKALDLGDKPAEAVAELRAAAAVAEAFQQAIEAHKDAFKGMKIDNPAEFVAELATALAEADTAVLDGEIDTLINDLVKAEAARPFVRDLMAGWRESGKVSDLATAETAINTYMETDTFKKLVSAQVSEMFGGNAIVGGQANVDAAAKAGFVPFEESVKLAQGVQ